MRIICRKPFDSPLNQLFYSLKILKLTDLYKFNVAIRIFKTNKTHFTRRHRLNTRFARENFPNFQRVSTAQRSFSFTGPTIWNSIPGSIKCAESLKSFKSNYKNYLISRYRATI